MSEKTISAKGDVGAQVQKLLKLRSIVAASDWEAAAHKFRSDFFGTNHKDLHFPVKLHMVVSCASLRDDIFWLDEGTSFAISRVGYQKHIMFVFFDQHKLKSFQNILNFYKFRTKPSFERVPVEDAHKFIIYHHPSFVRGRQDLSFKIRSPEPQRKVSGSESATNQNPSTSPTDWSADLEEEDTRSKNNHREESMSIEPRLFCSDSFDSESISSLEGMGDDVRSMLLMDLLGDGDVASTSGGISLTEAEEDELLHDLDIEVSVGSPSDTGDVDCWSFASLSLSCNSDEMSF